MNASNSLYVEHIIARYLAGRDGFTGTADELDIRAKTTPYPEDARDLYYLINLADEYNT